MTSTTTGSSDLSLSLPRVDGVLEAYRLVGTPVVATTPERPFTRIAYAAGHVVVDPLAPCDPWMNSVVDWDRTLAFREHLWSLGLGIAEAMDTAQRGMGVDWPTSLELIRRTSAAAGPNHLVVSGCGTDQLAPSDARSLDDVVRAYEEQIEAIQAAGSRLVLMASRALARVAKGPDDYFAVYGRLLRQVDRPVVLHWLGDMFDPALAGYWGSSDIGAAMDVVAGIIAEHAAKVDGIKISLLDAAHEVALRDRLPDGVRMYTGDDFNYVELIEGHGQRHSHALLGAFDAIAPVASAALGRLAANDVEGYRTLLKPTEALSRHLFAAPTQFYKTGVVFMAYLNGHQDHFTMAGGLESARSTLHLAEIFRMADATGLLSNPERAARRMRAVLAVRGVEA
ncbi:dihydrodipicolinate synthase family protein [Bosea sp. 117]|uniref:dihydrodipicolinate synthase family protein n=1 Tax=Bosea sp. 117 TaxID=1125973 RepID=UPI000493FF68|nr:dihydrodipicolinate synthase family protein [Bosea sp. 117]